MLHEAEILSRKQEVVPGEKESSENGNEPAAENQEELDRLTAEKIALAEQEVEALSREGETRMGQTNDSIGLSPEKVDEVSASLDIKNNLGKISEQARQLLAEMRSKIKSAAAIGMAALALGGAGNFERDGISILSESEVHATDVTKNGQTSSAAKIEDGAQKETIRPEKIEEKRKKIIEEAEKIRQDLVEHINSEDYLKRLIVEVGRSFDSGKNYRTYSPDEISESARRIRSMRTERLEKVKIIVLPLEDLQAVHKKTEADNGDNADGADNILAFARGTGEIYLPLDESNGDIILHELLHITTIDEDDLLSESYIKRNDKEDAYFGKGSERRAFKQALDEELEKFEIKKYGEIFTQEHFNKMMESYEQGKFSPGARLFIKTTKPEFFEKIFNEIAANEGGKQEELA